MYSTNLTEDLPHFPTGVGFCWCQKLSWLSKCNSKFNYQRIIQLAGASSVLEVDKGSRTHTGLLAMSCQFSSPHPKGMV